jgi:hypothetical protein
MTTHDLLVGHGYRLVEDAWSTDGRLTYVHDDAADRAHVAELVRTLGSGGWIKNRDKLRAFTNDAGNEIEIEPGGSDVSGHFLHHLNNARVTSRANPRTFSVSSSL